jgi:hypothetical protein
LRALLRSHARLHDSDVYVAGPAQAMHVAEFDLLEHGLPRAQLRLARPDA